MERDFADLYKNRNGQASWFQGISSDARKWLSDLADYIEDKGREPTWAAVYDRFTEKFPDDAPKTPGTITSTVRRLRGV